MNKVVMVVDPDTDKFRFFTVTGTTRKGFMIVEGLPIRPHKLSKAIMNRLFDAIEGTKGKKTNGQRAV